MSTLNATPQGIATRPDPSDRKPKHYSPKAETLALLKTSGNPINGLGETTQRRPSPFFWHPPTMHPFAGCSASDDEQMPRIRCSVHASPQPP